MDLATLIRYWVSFGISQAILGSSIMMISKGTLPPPLAHKKANPVFATALFVVGMTAMLVYGTPDLLQITIDTLIK